MPVFGTVLFILLYILAARLYPGGSQQDKHAKGFSWFHNYWCNLLAETGINGELNRGRPAAISAMVVLGASLVYFWGICPVFFNFTKIRIRMLQFSGLLSVVSFCFLSGEWHDEVINISGFFGLVAMAGVYRGIYRKKWYALFAFGIFNLALIALNNYVYHAGNNLYYLPLIQKLTFVSCLLWICLIDARIYRESEYIK